MERTTRLTRTKIPRFSVLASSGVKTSPQASRDSEPLLRPGEGFLASVPCQQSASPFLGLGRQGRWAKRLLLYYGWGVRHGLGQYRPRGHSPVFGILLSFLC